MILGDFSPYLLNQLEPNGPPNEDKTPTEFDLC